MQEKTGSATRVRMEQPADHKAIYRVNKEAFKRDDEALLVDRLRSSDEYIAELSLVAENDAGIVGHILFTRIVIEGAAFHYSLALAPMAVLPEYQRRGIGNQLVQTGLNLARDSGYESVIVLGHDSYYPRFGFKPASQWAIKCPFEVPDEAYMALELKKGALTGASGTVKYSPAFNAV